MTGEVGYFTLLDECQRSKSGFYLMPYRAYAQSVDVGRRYMAAAVVGCG